MKKLSKEKKYFRISISNLKSEKTDLFFLIKIIRKVNSNFSAHQIRFSNSQVNVEAYRFQITSSN